LWRHPERLDNANPGDTKKQVDRPVTEVPAMLAP
jgi:hypothetical protein